MQSQHKVFTHKPVECGKHACTLREQSGEMYLTLRRLQFEAAKPMGRQPPRFCSQGFAQGWQSQIPFSRLQNPRFAPMGLPTGLDTCRQTAPKGYMHVWQTNKNPTKGGAIHMVADADFCKFHLAAICLCAIVNWKFAITLSAINNLHFSRYFFF